MFVIQITETGTDIYNCHIFQYSEGQYNISDLISYLAKFFQTDNHKGQSIFITKDTESEYDPFFIGALTPFLVERFSTVAMFNSTLGKYVTLKTKNCFMYGALLD